MYVVCRPDNDLLTRGQRCMMIIRMMMMMMNERLIDDGCMIRDVLSTRRESEIEIASDDIGHNAVYVGRTDVCLIIMRVWGI